MRVLVVDWDETATVLDTTGALASLAAAKNPRATPDFAHYSDLYLKAYESYTQLQLPRNTVDEEIEFQKGMHGVELSSISALENNRYFKNISAEDLADLAPKVSLRSGFVEVMQAFAGPKIILSVNWCKTLIEQVLSLHRLSDVKVMANDFEYDSVGTTTGTFDKSMTIRTGYDKLLKLEEVREHYKTCTLIYVGDSSGDVLPIVMADIGILIEGGRGLAALEQLTKVLPVSEISEKADIADIDIADIDIADSADIAEIADIADIADIAHSAYRGTWEDIAKIL